MPRRFSPAAQRDAIDRRIAGTLSAASTDGLAPARARMAAFDDRWYGRLAFESFHAGQSGEWDVPESAGDAVPPAATAVELLRGYCSLRFALVLRDGTDDPRDASESVTARLLAGDYLFAAAFESLSESSDPTAPHERSPRVESCFETLAGTAERSIEAMAAADRRPTSIAEYASLIAETAGALGRWAARTGAILAGVPADRVGSVATVGRATSAHRQLRHALDPTDVPGPVTPFPGVGSTEPAPARDELRRRAERRRDEATAAIESLPASVDVAPLYPLVRSDAGSTNEPREGDDRDG